ncbi:MAG: leucine-rich repeat domain-containing protein [Candidatus Heimdallarchaeota archaeon]|nr:leucine-rich repeat domain-containing protein [Candidatus Heimdallarchaeota archaeon]
MEVVGDLNTIPVDEQEILKIIALELKLLDPGMLEFTIFIKQKRVDKVHLKFSNLVIIPVFLYQLTDLRELVVEGDKIVKIGDFDALIKLSSLVIRINHIEVISDNLLNLKLKTFLVFADKIDVVPEEMHTWIVNIEYAALRVKHYDNLPGVMLTIAEKSNFENMTFYIREIIAIALLVKKIPDLYNKKSNFPEDEMDNSIQFKTTGEYNISYVNKIGFSNMGLSSYPTEINSLLGLEILSLSKNQFTEIPIELAKLKKLRKLYLNHNKITKINNDLFKSKSLKIIHLENNELEEVETIQTQNNNLQELYLRLNNISTVGDLGNLRKLRILSLDQNKISNLSLSNANLTHLYLDHNPIDLLPKGIENMTKLQRMDVDIIQMDKNREMLNALDNSVSILIFKMRGEDIGYVLRDRYDNYYPDNATH